MARLSKKLFFFPKAIFRSTYFVLALALVVFLVLIIGHPILGPGLPGSDNANFITLADWLSKWFPRIPFWFPQEGGGMSFTASYPILNHLIVVIIEKLFSIPIAVAFRIWALVAIVLSSVGLYFLSFRLTKNQTVSAIAAIIYPLMPIMWIFLLSWGFAAEQLSYLFIPPVLIFLTLFLDEYCLKGLVLKTKIYFFLFAVIFAALLQAHPIVFVGTLMIVVPLFIIYPLLNFRSAGVSFKKAAGLGFKSIVVVFLLSSFWVFSFMKYQSVVGKGGPVEKETHNRNQFLQNGIYPLNVFNISTKTVGYTSYDDPPQYISGWAWHNASFPFIVSVLALVGFVGSLFINRKVFAFGLANLLPLTIAIVPQWAYNLLRLPFADYYLTWRSAIQPSRFVIPILAGFGCFVLAYLVTFPLDIISKKLKPVVLKLPIKGIFILLSTILTLMVAAVLIWRFKSWPDKYPSLVLSLGSENTQKGVTLDLRDIWRKEKYNLCFSERMAYSPEEFPLCHNYSMQIYFWEYKLDETCQEMKERGDNFSHEIALLCNSEASPELIRKVVDQCNDGTMDSRYLDICKARAGNLWDQLKPDSILAVLRDKDLFGQGKELFGSEIAMLDKLPDNPNVRVDVSSQLGAFMMFEPFYSDTPELPVYYNVGTLIKNFWNYQISVFNYKEAIWPQDIIMPELAKYFGIKYGLLTEELIPIDKYERTGWRRIDKWGQGTYGGLALWQYDDSVGLLRATTKPLVLVIGQDKVDGYFRIFHLANLGVLPFDDGLLVKGGSYVDAYSAKELKQFDAVILEGHAYKNHSKGWEVLNEYVENGGSLFINTGWQFSSADWQVKETPNFFPLNTLEWTSAGTADKYQNENSQMVGELDVDKFSPLKYGEKEWSISSSARSNLRDWATIVISANDMPLVAGGQYGSGKVVWTGLDLPGHIGSYKDNEEEVLLYKNLLAYLLSGKDGRDLAASFTRNYPDKLEITINESSSQEVGIYWSEAYYPDFKAKLVEDRKSQKIKTFKAGPGMTLFVLPEVSAGSKIIYEYKTPLPIHIARLISIITFATIIVVILKPKLLHRALGLFSEKTGNFGKKITGGLLGTKRDEDIDY